MAAGYLTGMPGNMHHSFLNRRTYEYSGSKGLSDSTSYAEGDVVEYVDFQATYIPQGSGSGMHYLTNIDNGSWFDYAFSPCSDTVDYFLEYGYQPSASDPVRWEAIPGASKVISVTQPPPARHIAVDSSGSPGLAVKMSGSNAMWWFERQGGTWSYAPATASTPTNDPALGGVFYDTSDCPHIIYMNNSRQCVIHAYRSSGTWTSTCVTAEFVNNDREHIGFFAASNNTIHLAYNTIQSSSVFLSYRTFDTSTNTFSASVAVFSGCTVDYNFYDPAIWVDSTGNVHLFSVSTKNLDWLSACTTWEYNISRIEYFLKPAGGAWSRKAPVTHTSDVLSFGESDSGISCYVEDNGDIHLMAYLYAAGPYIPGASFDYTGMYYGKSAYMTWNTDLAGYFHYDATAGQWDDPSHVYFGTSYNWANGIVPYFGSSPMIYGIDYYSKEWIFPVYMHIAPEGSDNTAAQTYSDNGGMWIDILLPFDHTVPPGPLTKFNNFQYTQELNGVGSFSFSAPATDAIARHLREFYTIRAWSIAGGKPRVICTGYITSITMTNGTDNIPMLEVRGSDLAYELQESYIEDEILGPHPSYHLYYQQAACVRKVWTDAGGGEATLTNAFDWPGGSSTYTTSSLYATDGPPEEFLYVQGTSPFSSVYFDFGTTSTTGTGASLRGQYYTNRVDPPTGTWLYLDQTLTQTYTGSFPLTADGFVGWATPLDWTPIDNTYQMRFHLTGCGRVTSNYNQVRIMYDRDVYPMAALQVGIWSDIRYFYYTSEGWYPSEWRVSHPRIGDWVEASSPLRLRITQISFLDMLRDIADITGDSFRINSSASPVYERVIEWIPSACTHYSGVYISLAHNTYSQESDPNSPPIANLSYALDSTDMATRVIPFGGGSGSSRVQLFSPNSSPAYTLPAGYNYNASLNAVERTSGSELIGYHIDRVMTFPGITSFDDSISNRDSAADYLARAAADWLVAHSASTFGGGTEATPHKRIVPPDLPTMINITTPLWYPDAQVGDSVRLDIFDVYSGSLAMAVSDYPLVTRKTTRQDSSGVLVTDWVVTTEKSYAKRLGDTSFDYRDLIERQYDATAGTMRLATSGCNAVPTRIKVSGGRITNVSALPTVRDDAYNSPTGITIERGVITKVV